VRRRVGEGGEGEAGADGAAGWSRSRSRAEQRALVCRATAGRFSFRERCLATSSGRAATASSTERVGQGLQKQSMHCTRPPLQVHTPQVRPPSRQGNAEARRASSALRNPRSGRAAAPAHAIAAETARCPLSRPCPPKAAKPHTLRTPLVPG
jgi:hypothetical protein